MIAACELCGELVKAKPKADNRLITTSNDEKAAAEVIDFDLLAAAVVEHLLQHHQNQAFELTQCANLAAKVYAMTHARSGNENFDELRKAWRVGIMQMLFPSAYTAGAAADAASSSSPLPPSVS
jgi:hypothetical protein